MSGPSEAPSPSGPERRWPLLAAGGFVLVAVGLLRAMGRVWWCACGSPAPWTSSATSSHTSQHLVDPYSFTHVLHGFVFFAILWLVLRKRAGPTARTALAVALEAGWELLENSKWVIDRYRADTIANDYQGDSIVNSLGDIACCTLGFTLARFLPWKASVAIVIAVELLLLAAIRDNLTLNLVMLVHPIPAVKTWQRGG